MLSSPFYPLNTEGTATSFSSELLWECPCFRPGDSRPINSSGWEVWLNHLQSQGICFWGRKNCFVYSPFLLLFSNWFWVFVGPPFNILILFEILRLTMKEEMQILVKSSQWPLSMKAKGKGSGGKLPRSDCWLSSSLRCMLSCFSPIQLFVTQWTVAHQAPLSMGILQARILEWGFHSLLQGIFLTQESNPGLLCLLHWWDP